MQNFSYHTHSTFSDGVMTVNELMQRAVELGWTELGISDHLIVHKNIRNSVSWPRWCNSNIQMLHSDFASAYEAFARRSDYIRQQARQYPLKVRIGAEVDFFTYSGWLEDFIDFRQKSDLDYYISGNHYMFCDDDCENIIDIKDANLLEQSLIEKAVNHHFYTLEQAASSGQFAFIAHIDYVRQVAICTKDNFLPAKQRLIKTLAMNGVATELSTKGLRKSGDYYPDSYLLNLLINNNISLVVSDDAHRVNEVGFGFLQAEDLLSRLNCRHRWQYLEK